MKVSTQIDLRKRVYALLGTNNKNFTLHHFLQEGISRRTLYNIFSRYDNNIEAENKKKSGRPPKLNEKQCKKLKECAQNKIGVSLRKLSRKFNVSKTCISDTLHKNSIKCFKRSKAPLYTEKQLAEIPKKCRLLRMKYLNGDKVLVMDDEKYFTFSNSSDVANQRYYTSNKQTTPDKIKLIQKSKFEPKILVWAAISNKGVSELYIQTSRSVSVNADIYISKCLTKLVKFIKKHHTGQNVIFWPDLASCHYAKKTTEWLKSKNVDLVPKKANPPNIPAARPIEDFWANLSKAVYSNGWEAKSAKQLKNRIRSCAKKMDIIVIQTMMDHVKSKLRQIEENGPLYVNH